MANLLLLFSIMDVIKVDSEADPTETKEPIPDSEESQKLVKRKVPDQLIMEFLINMMKHDYVVADKLCQMILLYDSEHKHALSFKPLLQEMIQAVKDNDEDDGAESSESEDSSELSDSDETDFNETGSNSNSDNTELESDPRDQD